MLLTFRFKKGDFKESLTKEHYPKRKQNSVKVGIISPKGQFLSKVE